MFSYKDLVKESAESEEEKISYFTENSETTEEDEVIGFIEE